MTGASVIRGADTVSPKEEAIVSNQSLVIDQPLPKGSHIRYRGEEVRKGEPLLSKNALIHPGTIAVLTSFGINKIKVFRKPRISVIATGSELVAPGRRLKPGKIYDSNSWMIDAALQEMRIDVVYKKTVADRPQLIRKVLQRAHRISDMVILLGGVSVGDYDYVKDILTKEGVQKIFWQVDQKPGNSLNASAVRSARVSTKSAWVGSPLAVVRPAEVVSYPRLSKLAVCTTTVRSDIAPPPRSVPSGAPG